MSPIAHPTPRQFAGFSLVEIMVAMVIGMFGIIVMMQVFALSEERKRTTTSGGDAMTEGVMGLYGLQRDIRMGGYGIGDVSVLGCNVTLPTSATPIAMAPVTINPVVPVTNAPFIPAGDPNTDTLLVVYGNSNTSPQGDGIKTAGTNTTYGVSTPTSFVANDRLIAAPQTRGAPCNLRLDTVVASGANVTVITGVNPSIGDTVFNLGQKPKIVAYAIRGGNLTACDYMVNDCSIAANAGSAAIWVPIANNIVSLRAQYGRDTAVVGAMDGFVDVYDQATPNPVLTPNTACGWARISAIRLALVARSAQFEKTAVTAVPLEWDGTTAGNPAGSTSAPIDVSKNPDGTANAYWQNYRYKLFQTVMPIRNIAWLGVVSGC